MIDLSSYYKGIETNADGIEVKLVYASDLPRAFEDNADLAQFGRKTKETRAYIAEPGELIVTQHKAGEENRYVAKGGEVVFDNGGGDRFVPRDEEGRPNGAAILQDPNKYECVDGSLESGNAVYIPAGKPSRIITNANQDHIRILNPWGEGSMQDLPPGSTLKLDGAKVTGIEGEAFAKTWSITDEKGEILPNIISSAETQVRGTPESPHSNRAASSGYGRT